MAVCLETDVDAAPRAIVRWRSSYSAAEALNLLLIAAPQARPRRLRRRDSYCAAIEAGMPAVQPPAAPSPSLAAREKTRGKRGRLERLVLLARQVQRLVNRGPA
ncbi:uncharacterized protein LOC134534834 [Bacillus rossius redtenbacheri]|uniref:uncharacterized protein LOC134534834 n=1 Tax=Bacillus rossius redtenbacheri TaxID=93214 RepID=UPI002FDE6482